MHSWSRDSGEDAIPLLSESESEGEDVIQVLSELGEDAVRQSISTGYTANY